MSKNTIMTESIRSFAKNLEHIILRISGWDILIFHIQIYCNDILMIVYFQQNDSNQPKYGIRTLNWSYTMSFSLKLSGPHTLRVAPICIMNGFQHKWYFILNSFPFSKKFFHKPQVFQQHIPNNQNKDHPNWPRWPWLSGSTSYQFYRLLEIFHLV